MLKWLSKKKTHKRWDPSTPLVTFSRRDRLTIGDAFENTLVLGGSGSGKTTGSCFTLLMAMMALGFGGLILTTKVDDADRMVRLARRCGRDDDIVVFGEDNGSQFNFLKFQHAQQRGESGYTENLINLFEDLMQLADRVSGQPAATGGEQYWSYSKRELLRNTIDLVTLATGTVDMGSIHDVLRHAPRSIAEAEHPDWQASSLLMQGLLLARHRAITDQAIHDIEQIERYFLRTYAKLHEKTRSIVDSMVYGFLDLFTRGTLYRLFCQGTNVSPLDCLNGKIIVLDQPVKRDLAIGVIAQSLFKTQFQQTLEQRSASQERPCFLYIDECQSFLSARDSLFAATARGSRCANLFSTQSISNMRMAMAANDAGMAAVDSLVGLCGTKIFHQNSDAPSNSYASDLFGRRRIRLRSSSVSHPELPSRRWIEEGGEMSTSISEAFEPILEPHVFTSLKKGGLPDLETQAIVFSGGRKWHASGDTYLKVSFKQGI